MRLFYVSSGVESFSILDPNIIRAFEMIQREDPSFQFQVFQKDKEPLETLRGKIKRFETDVIISFRGTLPRSIVNQIKKLKIPIGIWVVDDPHNIKRHLIKSKPYDFVITQESSCVQVYESHKKKCIHLPLAVNPELYYPQKSLSDYEYDICFVGSGLPKRIEYFDHMTPFLLEHKSVIVGRFWEKLKNFEKLKAMIINEPIPPEETLRYYNGAKIVLNIHRSNNDIGNNPLEYPANTPNNRTFDIAACNAFQLCCFRPDLSQLYKIGEEIICYDNVVDLQEKINYYLKHEEKRMEIKEKGFKRTLQDHTYKKRMKHLIAELGKKNLVRKK